MLGLPGESTYIIIPAFKVQKQDKYFDLKKYMFCNVHTVHFERDFHGSLVLFKPSIMTGCTPTCLHVHVSVNSSCPRTQTCIRFCWELVTGNGTVTVPGDVSRRTSTTRTTGEAERVTLI